jgi:cell division protein FtsI (penicillin-binding protein 3)
MEFALKTLRVPPSGVPAPHLPISFDPADPVPPATSVKPATDSGR